MQKMCLKIRDLQISTFLTEIESIMGAEDENTLQHHLQKFDFIYLMTTKRKPPSLPGLPDILVLSCHQIPPTTPLPASQSVSQAPAICSMCPDMCMSAHEKPSGSNRLLPLRLQRVVCPLHTPLYLATNPPCVYVCVREGNGNKRKWDGKTWGHLHPSIKWMWTLSAPDTYCRIKKMWLLYHYVFQMNLQKPCRNALCVYLIANCIIKKVILCFSPFFSYTSFVKAEFEKHSFQKLKLSWKTRTIKRLFLKHIYKCMAI